jgi:hypothetical protein
MEMEAIRSGTTVGRIVRAGLLMALLNGFAIAFLWDGYVGYARKNARELASSLGLPSDPLPVIDPKLTAAGMRGLVEELKAGTVATAVTARLGEPGIEHGGDSYYLGPGGHLLVQYERGRMQRAEWVHGRHDETDLVWQRWIGYVLLIVGLCALGHFLRVVTTRVSLTPDGLKVTGRPLIPIDTLNGVRADESGGGLSVTITYEVAGRERVITLDDYKVKELPALVSAICHESGLADPFQPDGGDGSEQADT